MRGIPVMGIQPSVFYCARSLRYSRASTSSREPTSARASEWTISPFFLLSYTYGPLKLRLTIGVLLNYNPLMPSKKHKPLPELGKLERAVLEHLWRAGEADVIETHRAVGARRGITVNTIGSALERLHRKGLVTRWKVSHAYRYEPTLDRESFVVRQMVDGVGGVRALTSRGLLASFLDLVADADDAALDELEELIARKRKEGQT
jgi:predicted transcriptional regulator